MFYIFLKTRNSSKMTWSFEKWILNTWMNLLTSPTSSPSNLLFVFPIHWVISFPKIILNLFCFIPNNLLFSRAIGTSFPPTYNMSSANNNRWYLTLYIFYYFIHYQSKPVRTQSWTLMHFHFKHIILSFSTLILHSCNFSFVRVLS